MGFEAWRSRAKGKAMLPLDIWLHILVILFYPTLVSLCNALPKKVPKRIIQKKRHQQIRDKDISFILSFIYWVFSTSPWMREFSLNILKWLSPQLRCQKFVNRFHVCMYVSTFGISGFLLEVCQSPVSCGSCIFQHNADRERAATGWKGLTNATSKDVCMVPRHQKAMMLSKCWSLPERERMPGPICQEECLFSFMHASSPFPVRDLWEFLQI